MTFDLTTKSKDKVFKPMVWQCVHSDVLNVMYYIIQASEVSPGVKQTNCKV